MKEGSGRCHVFFVSVAAFFRAWKGGKRGRGEAYVSKRKTLADRSGMDRFVWERGVRDSIWTETLSSALLADLSSPISPSRSPSVGI